MQHTARKTAMGKLTLEEIIRKMQEKYKYMAGIRERLSNFTLLTPENIGFA